MYADFSFMTLADRTYIGHENYFLCETTGHIAQFELASGRLNGILLRHINVIQAPHESLTFNHFKRIGIQIAH